MYPVHRFEFKSLLHATASFNEWNQLCIKQKNDCTVLDSGGASSDKMMGEIAQVCAKLMTNIPRQYIATVNFPVN